MTDRSQLWTRTDGPDGDRPVGNWSPPAPDLLATVVVVTEPRPFQPLHDRLAGRSLDQVLLPGVPEHLEHPLRNWIDEALDLDSSLAEDAVVSLQWSLVQSADPYGDTLGYAPTADLMTVVDALLQLNAEHGFAIHATHIARLNTLLRLGRSAYRVENGEQGLTWRVDPTVEEAVQQTTGSAQPTAADLLRKAWHHVYKPDPDPTAAYRDAVRAIEEAFVPVVSPNNVRASLGTVCRDLENQQADWELVFVDTGGAPAVITPLVGLLKQLWQGQRSRHGGGSTSREQTLDEAAAAVHLSVLAVHWLTAGVLRRKQ